MKRKNLVFINIVFLVLINNCYADLISPTAEKLQDRANAHPKLFDRTDQFCLNKKVQDPCTIPGNQFSGGGNGLCLIELNEKDDSIDLYCQLSEYLDIDRNLPNSPYHAPRDCKELRNVTCDEAPLAKDKFCSDKNPGDACEVTGKLKVKGKVIDSLTHEGVCKIIQEEKQGYLRGRIILTRPILLCSSTTPAPDHEFKEIGVIRKIWNSTVD